ncbi:MAG: asparagine synthase (glutamine-hydrolyzing), partial [Candidatus Omnitrophica bacterium]|nr:asparagine synthase (glutamine-hydrolyzing) [Candidatus Omnitrophota bacterium]
RLGIKPLYYYMDGEGIVFASEIKAILQDKKVKAALNQRGLNDYISFQFCLGDETLFKGIKKLLPGHMLSVKGKHVKVKKYWDLEFKIDEGRDADYYSKKLMMLIEDAVRLRLRSDVSIGAYLSGGIDSSTIVCCASSLLGAPLKTFTGYFKEGIEFDERRYATEISKFNKTNHFETCITAKDFIKSFDKLIYFLDEPVAGPGVLPQHFVSRAASENVKVVLGGQGGDEIFGGYVRYFLAYFEDSIGKLIFDGKTSLNQAAELKAMMGNLSQLKGYQPLMRYFWQEGLFESSDKRYYRLIRKDAMINQLLSDDALAAHSSDDAFERCQEIFNQFDKDSLINKMMHFDVKTLLPALLQVEDRASMGASLESRVPLLDHR